MSKFVHFLGYASALVVVGILIMTATGQLSPILRGDLGYSSSDMMNVGSSEDAMPSSDMMYDASSSDDSVSEDADSSPVMMVPSLLDPMEMVPSDYNDLSNTEIVVVSEDAPMMSAFEPETGSSGGDAEGGTAGPAFAGAAVTCAPGVDSLNKGGSTDDVTISVTKKPANSKFEYQALIKRSAELKQACFDGKDVPCADSTNCLKDPNQKSKASFDFGKCAVQAGPTAVKDKKGKIVGWKATVKCDPASCKTTQVCIAKQHCCFADGDKTVAACKTSCDGTEVDGGMYAPAECPMQCKPVNVLCCQPSSGAPTCNATCPSGSTKKAVLGVNNCNATTCSSSSSSTSPSVSLCCKNTLGNNNYACKASCGTGESGVPIIGACDTATNCKFSSSSSSPAPQVCCTNTNKQYYCKATCDSYSPTGVSISGTCDVNTNCKPSSTPSSPPTTVPNPPPPPPSSGGSSSRCTGSTPVGTTCSNSNPCDSPNGDCYCRKAFLDINGTCQ